MNHVFIGYRVASDRSWRDGHDLLSEMMLDDTERRIESTWTRRGWRTDSGGIASWKTRGCLYIVSVGSVGPMCQLGGGGDEEGAASSGRGEDWTDNVLLSGQRR